MIPAARIRAGGRDITAAVSGRLLELAITDEAGVQADTCTLKLDDRAPGIALPPTGETLHIELGFRESGLAAMGAYVVDEVEAAGPPAVVTLRGKAADMTSAIKAPKTRSWPAVTLGRLVAGVAREHGLEVRVDPALADIRLPHIDQTEESDLQLLTRIGADYDAVAAPKGGRLVFLRRQTLAASQAAIGIDRAEAATWRFTWADRQRFAAAVARWHDPGSGQPATVRAGAATGGPVYTLANPYPDAASARNAAEAALRRLERGTGTAALTLAVGRPALAAEAPVRLSGFGERRDGDWIATRVSHAFGGQGYTTSLDLETVTTPWTRVSSPPLSVD